MTTIAPRRKPTVAESLTADMRPMRLTVTSGHTLDFIGHGHRLTVTVPAGRDNDDAPLRFATTVTAYEHLRAAEGATAALMALVFGVRADGKGSAA